MNPDAGPEINIARLKGMFLAGLEGPDPVLEPRTSLPAAGAWTPPECEELQALAGDLQVECLIGRGGMGAVYRCHDPGLNRPVALKLLPPALAADPQIIARFSEEGRAMARLRHENIVTVYRCIGTEGHSMLVMEYVEGADLAKLLRQSQEARAGGAPDPLPLMEGLRIFTEVCAGVACAHAEGVLHRDLKPANILIDNKSRARVADFGLARDLNPATAEADLEERIMGSLTYMAPEQLRGGPVDHRTDVFALGVILREIIAGGPAPDAEEAGRRPGTPRRLAGIVARAMAMNPAARWQSAEELRAAVERVRECLKYPPWLRALRCAAMPVTVAGSAAVLALLLSGEKPADGTVKQTQDSGLSADPPGMRLTFQGQKLVPVPGLPHLWAGMWELRVRDFSEFVSATGYVTSRTIRPEKREFETSAPILTWDKPGRAQEPDYPVTCLSWDDADAYCVWLTAAARERGEIKAPAEYRLLTDREWSVVAGVPEDAGAWSWLRTARPDVFSWGHKLPRQPGWENHGGTDPEGGGPRDRWNFCAPVGSLRRHGAGFYDLGGNVREWVLDSFEFTSRRHVARSSGFRAKQVREQLTLARRSDCWLDAGNDTLGLRICLDLKSPAAMDPAVRAEAAVLAFHGGKLPSLGQRARAWATDEGLKLDLTHAGVATRLEAFAGLPVTELLLGPDNAGADLSALKLDALRRLHVEGGWPQLASLAGAQALEYLTIDGTGGPDIAARSRPCALEGLPTAALRGVCLRDFPGLTSIAALAGATKLEQLYLIATGVTDLQPLGALALRELDVSGSPIDARMLTQARLVHEVPFSRRCLGPAWEALHAGNAAAALDYLRTLKESARVARWYGSAAWQQGVAEAVKVIEAVVPNSAASGPGTGQVAWEWNRNRCVLVPGRYFPGDAWWMATVLGGHPVVPTTAAEMTFITSRLKRVDGGFHLGALSTAAGNWQWCSGEPWGFSMWTNGMTDNGLSRAGYFEEGWWFLQDCPQWLRWQGTELADRTDYMLLVEWEAADKAPPVQALQTALARTWADEGGEFITLRPDGRVGDQSIASAWWYVTDPAGRVASVWEYGGMRMSTVTLGPDGESCVWQPMGSTARRCRPRL